MDSKHISNSIYFLLVAISFSFPFGRMFTSPLLIILFAAFLPYIIFRGKRTLDPQLDKRKRVYVLLPASYYLLCIIGLIYTYNIKEGIYELDKKITLVAFPVLFLFFFKELTGERLNNILKSYLAGITTCALISVCLGFYYSTSIVNGTIQFRTAVNDFVHERGDSFFEQVTQGGNYFFGPYISPFIHTNYYGLYLSLGIIIASYFFIISERKYRYLVIALLLFCMLILTDSRGPLISFLFCIPIVILFSVRNRLTRISLPLLIAGIIAVISISPRTSLLFFNLQETIENVRYDSEESTMLRLVVWDAAIEIIRDNWLWGVGTGDREDAMLNVTRHKNKAAFQMKLNAHNQYFEAFLTFGISGLIVIVALILVPLRRALSRRQHLLAAFLTVIGLNMLFESALQVFQGIAFFSFFFGILTLHSIRRNETTSFS